MYCLVCGKKQADNSRKPLKRGNGTGTVYKLPGRRKKPWVAPKNRIIIGYYNTKQEALEVLEKYRRKSIDERINTTFGEAYTSWNEAHSKNIEDDTADGYQYVYKYFSEIKNAKLRELRTSDFRQIIDKQFSEGKSRSTMEKCKSLAKQICDWGIVQEIIQTNFAEYTTLPKLVKKSKPIFREDEIELLFANDQDTAPNGGRLIDGYSGNRDKDNFRSRDFNPVMKRLGIEGKTPHSTRHTFATMMSKADAGIENLQQIIGHKKYSTTAEIYIHPNVAKLKEEINKI